MSFWTENYKSDTVNNPKRNFRFKVQFTEMNNLTGYDDSVLFYAKTAQKPSFSLGEATHAFLNHTFKFPGRVTWNDVTITMVDPGPNTGDAENSSNGVASALTKILNNSGYVIPATPGEDFVTISKSKAVSAIGSVIITQLDHNGSEIEKWTLYNAFISDVKYGDLSYEDDNLTEYSVSLRYDWAEYEGIKYTRET